MSAFVSSEFSSTIPSKSIIQPSMRQLEYLDGQTLRFQIPSFASHLDSRQSYLKFRVKIRGATTLLTFSKKSGVHSLIQNLRIYDAQTNTLLENIQEYAQLSQILHIYSENRSIRNRRGLTELLEYTSRTFGNEEVDNLPARTCDQSQLFVSMPTGSDPTYATDVPIDGRAQECVVALRLYSGVLGSLSSKMFPSFIVGGINVECDLNPAAAALGLWTCEGICDDQGLPDPTLGDGDSCRFGIVAPDDPAGALTKVELYCERNAGFDQLVEGADLASGYPPLTSALPLQNGTSIVKNQGVGSVNLAIGKHLYGWSNEEPPVMYDMGIINAVGSNAGEDSGDVVSVTVELRNVPAGTTGSLFVGGAGNKAD